MGDLEPYTFINSFSGIGCAEVKFFDIITHSFGDNLPQDCRGKAPASPFRDGGFLYKESPPVETIFPSNIRDNFYMRPMAQGLKKIPVHIFKSSGGNV